ncbi:hypothetical protein Tco_1107967 [Tanacetum coccineum]
MFLYEPASPFSGLSQPNQPPPAAINRTHPFCGFRTKPNAPWWCYDDGDGVVVAVVAAAGDGRGPTVRGGSGCDGDEGGGGVTRQRQPKGEEKREDSTREQFKESKRRARTKEKLLRKQKVEEDKESEELKKYLEIVPDDGDDVTIDATPLSIKSPTIVDYKIYQEGKKRFFQIIRADDSVWKNQQGLVKVLNWKLYDSCGVHCVTMQNILYYLLVEKMYPLTKHTLHQMFNDVKLQVDYECEMAFELLRLVKKQLKEGYGRIVGIKSLLEVTAVKLVLLVQKLLLLVLKVNAAGIKVTTAERLQLLKG